MSRSTSSCIWMRSAAWLSRSRRFLKDSYELCGDAYKGYRLLADSAAPSPTIFLNQRAKADNLAAQSLLKAYKNVIMIKYKGPVQFLIDYYNAKRGVTNHVEGVKGTSPMMIQSSESSTENGKKRARVAFMITAAQRMILKKELGLNEAVIKTLTPIQASLIIENKLSYKFQSADLFMEKLNELITYNEELMEQRKIQAQDDSKVSHCYRNIGDRIMSKIAVSETTQLEGQDKPLYANHGDSHHKEAVDEAKDVTWFEVTKIYKTGEAEKEYVVALYKTIEEANNCCEWKQKRNKEDKLLSDIDISFKVRIRK